MQITIELPEDIAVGLESKWKDLPRAALEGLAIEAYRSRALRCRASAAPCFRDAHGGRRFSKGARNLRRLGRGLRTGPGNAPSATGERGSALSRLSTWLSRRHLAQSTTSFSSSRSISSSGCTLDSDSTAVLEELRHPVRLSLFETCRAPVGTIHPRKSMPSWSARH